MKHEKVSVWYQVVARLAHQQQYIMARDTPAGGSETLSITVTAFQGDPRIHPDFQFRWI